jgi:hypothetical protein
MLPNVGQQFVGTVTVTASGYGTIEPVKSNVPFTNLTIIIKPLDIDSQYKVDVYHFGQLAETHNYPAANDSVIAYMMFPSLIFPANVGTHSIPAFFDPSRQDFGGVPVVVQITNHEASTRVFEVYAIMEQFEGCRFGKITQTK